MKKINQDEKFMKEAIKEAKAAKASGDLPFGAVVVKGGKIVARGRSQEESKKDLTTHAEMGAIRELTIKGKSFNLSGYTIYTTSEPCVMCSWAIFKTKISNIVIGIMRDDYHIFFKPRKIRFKDFLKDSNYKPKVKYGVCKEEIKKLFA